MRGYHPEGVPDQAVAHAGAPRLAGPPPGRFHQREGTRCQTVAQLPSQGVVTRPEASAENPVPKGARPGWRWLHDRHPRLRFSLLPGRRGVSHADRLPVAELPQDLSQLATDLVEPAVDLYIEGVDLLVDPLDQLVQRVDVAALLAYLALDLGLGHQ